MIQIDSIKKNATGVIIEVLAVNGTGKGVTGITTADLVIRRWSRGKAGASVSGAPVAGTIDTFVSNGWKEVDATNLKGVYQYSIPNVDVQATAGLLNIAFEFNSASVQDVLYQALITPVDSLLGVAVASDGLDAVAVGALSLTEFLPYLGAVVGGETEGAETSKTLFKEIGDNSITRLTSQSDDGKNRNIIELL
jgi:hypothetical protein